MEIHAEKINHTVFSEGDNNTNTLNVGNGDNLAALAEAVRNHATLDPKKLSSLKRELLALSKSTDVPMTVRMKMIPLVKALESVEDDDKKLLDALKPYIGDAESLTKTATLLGELGGKFLSLMRKYFLPV